MRWEVSGKEYKWKDNLPVVPAQLESVLRKWAWQINRKADEFNGRAERAPLVLFGQQ